MLTTPVCEECGNKGDRGGLYVTVDARWDPVKKCWALERRTDDGGCQLDCTQCDHTTEEGPDRQFFPYGDLPLDPLEAWRALTGS